MARVFLYNVNDEEKRIKIQLAALRCGLKSVIVPPEDFSLPVGALLGGPGYPPSAGAGEGFEDEMLLMEEMDGAFLDLLRQSRAPVALKAVVTGQNKAWSSEALHRELRREHEAMQKARPADAAKKSAHKK
jgi:hypothetical protein